MLELIRNDRNLNAAAYAVAISGAFAILIWFYDAGDGTLKVLLWPHAAAASAVYAMPMQYIGRVGYTALNGAVSIGRECIGINFIASEFVMLSCLFARKFAGWRKALWLLISFAASALTGLAVGCARVLGSIPFAYHGRFIAVHTGIGITLYFIAFIGSFFFTRKLLKGV
jgi:exosortase K